MTPTTQKIHDVRKARILASATMLFLGSTAEAVDACQAYAKLAALPASFRTISRSAIGPAKMEIKTDGTYTCNDLPVVRRSLGQQKPDGINFACDAADPLDKKSQ